MPFKQIVVIALTIGVAVYLLVGWAIIKYLVS